MPGCTSSGCTRNSSFDLAGQPWRHAAIFSELPELNLPHTKEFQELLIVHRAFKSRDYQEATAALQKAIREKKAAEAQALWDKA